MFLQQIFFQNRENPFSQNSDSGIIDLSLFDSFMFTIENKQKWNSSKMIQSSLIPSLIPSLMSCSVSCPVHCPIPCSAPVPRPTHCHVPHSSISEIKMTNNDPKINAIPEFKCEIKESPVIPEKEIIPINNIDIHTKIQKYTFYASGVQDQLFWTVFIAKYGYNAYSNIGKQFGNVEMKEKQLIADYIHTQGSIEISKQTNYKLTRALCCEIVSDLVTSPKMTYSSFIAYCAYYKTSIFIVDAVKNTYIPFLYSGKEGDPDSSSEPIIIYKNPFFREKKTKDDKEKRNEGTFIKNMFFVEAGQSVLSVDDIQNTMLSFEHYEKPLKTISNYKTSDLEEIADRLKVSIWNEEENKKYKKNELYAKIIEYLMNL